MNLVTHKGNMGQEKKEALSPQKLAQNLAAYAIDRTDTNELLATLPKDSRLNTTTIEYELQILKILTVGWAISFFMPAAGTKKDLVSQEFWDAVREVSNNVSTLTRTTTGQDINYFDILKNRLDTYVGVLQENQQDTQNPAHIMGPAFARACQTENNAFVILIGTKMFSLTLGAVKAYLNGV